MLEELTTEQKIEIVLDKIRPFIRRDGSFTVEVRKLMDF